MLASGAPFLYEGFANNAFVYASIQVLKCGSREDGWHTDGGSSLLHAALTLFGTRRVDVECGEDGCISLHQEPGSFYMGNLCALNHNVVHDEHPTGTYGDGASSERVQIAVMLRSDVFRNARARKMNATPGPAELFRIVNRETAKHLAEEALQLPDLAAVLAECTVAQSVAATLLATLAASLATSAVSAPGVWLAGFCSLIAGDSDVEGCRISPLRATKRNTEQGKQNSSII